MELVSVDIGGTHARFTIATIGDDGAVTGRTGDAENHRTCQFESAWEHFAQISGRVLPRAAALAVAGPVGGELIVSPTTRVIRPDQLPERLGVDKVTIVNDFGAVGHAVAHAGEEHFQHLTGPDVPCRPAGRSASWVRAPGLAWRMCGATATASITCRHRRRPYRLSAAGRHRGCHSGRLRQRHRRVSVERVVSGPAIVDIYETLAALEQRPIVHDDRTIWTKGTAGETR
jgi:glucokinase